MRLLTIHWFIILYVSRITENVLKNVDHSFREKGLGESRLQSK